VIWLREKIPSICNYYVKYKVIDQKIWKCTAVYYSIGCGHKGEEASLVPSQTAPSQQYQLPSRINRHTGTLSFLEHTCTLQGQWSNFLCTSRDTLWHTKCKLPLRNFYISSNIAQICLYQARILYIFCSSCNRLIWRLVKVKLNVITIS
jgi:hypothetical protein